MLIRLAIIFLLIVMLAFAVLPVLAGPPHPSMPYRMDLPIVAVDIVTKCDLYPLIPQCNE